MVVFKTERLIVRKFTNADSSLFFMLNGNEEVMRYIRKALSQHASDLFLKANIEFYSQHPHLGRWCVIEKESGDFIGTFALIFLPFEDEKDNIQIGYALLPKAQGKGYATELTKAGVKFFFKHYALNELHAITALENVASQKVLLKCGFTENGVKQEGEGTVRRYILKSAQIK